jgi:hypothetical protein
MVSKLDITNAFNSVFDNDKQYHQLSDIEKLYALLVLVIDNGISTGNNGGTTDLVDIIRLRDKTTETNQLVITSDGKIGISNSDYAKTTDISTVVTKLNDILTELAKKADLDEIQEVSLTTIPLATNAATEANQTTTNTSLSSINTKLTTVNTRALTSTDIVSAVQSGNWSITNVTGTVALPTNAATETTLATLSGKLPSVLASDRLKVTTVFDTAQPVSVNNFPTTQAATNVLLRSTATITRPADTTAYAANDVIAALTTAATPITFTNSVASNGIGYLVGAKLTRTNTVSQLLRFRLYLYATQPTGQNDNAAFLLNFSERLGRTYIDFTAWQFPAGSDSQESMSFIGASIPLVIPTGTTVWGILVALDSFTPIASEQFAIELMVES